MPLEIHRKLASGRFRPSSKYNTNKPKSGTVRLAITNPKQITNLKKLRGLNIILNGKSFVLTSIAPQHRKIGIRLKANEEAQEIMIPIDSVFKLGKTVKLTGEAKEVKVGLSEDEGHELRSLPAFSTVTKLNIGQGKVFYGSAQGNKQQVITFQQLAKYYQIVISRK